MSDQILITSTELFEQLKSPGIVLIDTRDPKTYSAAHLPRAVNIHDIFTYLATSTPERVGGDARQVRRHLRHSRSLWRRSGGGLRTIDEYRLWPVVPRLRAAALPRLSKSHDPARRLCGMDGGWTADHDGSAGPAAQNVSGRSQGCRNSRWPSGDERRGRRPQPNQTRHARCRRVDRRQLFALRQGFLPAQGSYPRRRVDRIVSHDEAHPGGTDVFVTGRNPRRVRNGRH